MVCSASNRRFEAEFFYNLMENHNQQMFEKRIIVQSNHQIKTLIIWKFYSLLFYRFC